MDVAVLVSLGGRRVERICKMQTQSGKCGLFVEAVGGWITDWLLPERIGIICPSHEMDCHILTSVSNSVQLTCLWPESNWLLLLSFFSSHWILISFFSCTETRSCGQCYNHMLKQGHVFVCPKLSLPVTYNVGWVEAALTFMAHDIHWDKEVTLFNGSTIIQLFTADMWSVGS